jgi:hypothetical protein
LSQLDVSTAFLNGDIEEEIFMQLPAHLEEYLKEIISESAGQNPDLHRKSKLLLCDLKNGCKPKICRLNKALYGLRQAGHQWFKKLDTQLKALGFQPSFADPCIYTSSKGGDYTIIAVYVDDLIIASSSDRNLRNLKQNLMASFDMRDLGNLRYCLGIEFSQ